MEATEHRITAAQVKAARDAFEANEPRDLFYRAATELVDLASKGSTSLSVAEALAVLLQTWNKSYYQYRKFDAHHFASVEKLLANHRAALGRYRRATIEELSENERPAVSRLFEEFETVLGPVGAAKALHLLAPHIFPLWDHSIADAYDLSLDEAGSNGERYWKFMLIARAQCFELRREAKLQGNPLKAIDEYNDCKHTKGWLR